MITVLVLSVSGIYLTFRAWTAMQIMLSPAPTAASVGGMGQVTMVENAQARDAELALVSDPDRDPFHPVRRARTTPVRTQAPEPPPRPQLRMILYDQLSPEVQFSVGDVLSGRLKPGQSFRGWKILSISARSCVVTKDGQTLTLTPRR